MNACADGLDVLACIQQWLSSAGSHISVELGQECVLFAGYPYAHKVTDFFGFSPARVFLKGIC